MTDINWVNPSISFPECGRCVGVITYHTKSNWPLSAQIMFGIVEHVHGKTGFIVQSYDCTGDGCYYESYIDGSFENTIFAWAYSTDFAKPEFMKHDTHFDMLKLNVDRDK